MNVTINPIVRTDQPFCEAENCFATPTYCVTSQDKQTGTETVAVVCPQHIKDVLPEFAEAS